MYATVLSYQRAKIKSPVAMNVTLSLSYFKDRISCYALLRPLYYYYRTAAGPAQVNSDDQREATEARVELKHRIVLQSIEKAKKRWARRST